MSKKTLIKIIGLASIVLFFYGLLFELSNKGFVINAVLLVTLVIVLYGLVSDLRPVELLLMASLISSIALMVGMEHEDDLMDIEHYCYMVSLWNQDESKGIPEIDRGGWPPYKGEDICK